MCEWVLGYYASPAVLVIFKARKSQIRERTFPALFISLISEYCCISFKKTTSNPVGEPNLNLLLTLWVDTWHIHYFLTLLIDILHVQRAYISNSVSARQISQKSVSSLIRSSGDDRVIAVGLNYSCSQDPCESMENPPEFGHSFSNSYELFPGAFH